MSTEQPRYIVVEGPIGVGKTSLARRLADSLGGEILLEGADENPFLDRFYENPRSGALSVQLYFLLQRVRQIEAMRQSDLFAPLRVADFLLEKDRLFAETNLDADELRLYEQVYANLTFEAPRPDLVIYLQAPVPVLMQRVAKRGRRYERMIDSGYLQRLADAYTRFFYYYTASPLLVVNAAEIDLVNNDRDYELLLKRVREKPAGRYYFNPAPMDV